MALLEIPGVAIRGVAAAVPEHCIDNLHYATKLGIDNAAKIIRSIGVEQRHTVTAGQCTSDLCHVAAERLVKRLDWDRASIDALIFVSQTPDYRLPATSCILQQRLQLRTSCLTFDVGMGCSGYTHGLQIAGSLLVSGFRRVLLLAGDTISRTIDDSDHSTAMLFGDAGTATALEASTADTVEPMTCESGTDGRGAHHLKMRGEASAMRQDADDKIDAPALYMNGTQVFAFTLKRVPELVLGLIQSTGHRLADIDLFAFHQANAFMLEHLRKKIGIRKDRFAVAMRQYGNTSCASIPLALCASLDQTDTHTTSKRLCLVGFGVGLSWSAVIVNVQAMAVEPIIKLGPQVAGGE